MKRWFLPGFLTLLVLAAALRLPDLRLRPLHNDEAVNAMNFRNLWTGPGYKYNPNEFHGPTLPHFTLPAAWLSGASDFNALTETSFRTVTAVFGIALIALLLLLTPEFGRAETLWAAALTAISPAMVFYSRYYIHETLLVFFTALAAMAWWRYCRSGRFGWCALAGAGLGLMWATKETFVFAVLSLVLAAACAVGWSRWRGEPGLKRETRRSFGALAIVAGIAVVVAMIFFSSFFTNASGMADAFKTYLPWLHRAEGASVHIHSWQFYFERLLFYRANGGPLWTEALIVGLAVVGSVAALVSRRFEPAQAMLVRTIAFYTGWMTLIYTSLPYKTPWCLLGFFHGMILLAGFGAVALLRCFKPPLRCGMMALLIAAAVQLGCQAWRENFAIDKGGVPYCDSVKSPYAYSQTTPDIFRLVQTVEALAKTSPDGYRTIVEVMSPESSWPLPWYLRRFTKFVGYFDQIPSQPLAPIMIVSTDLHAGFDERPERSHLMAGYFELRPGVFYELYVSVDLWTRYLKTLPPEKN